MIDEDVVGDSAGELGVADIKERSGVELSSSMVDELETAEDFGVHVDVRLELTDGIVEEDVQFELMEGIVLRDSMELEDELMDRIVKDEVQLSLMDMIDEGDIAGIEDSNVKFNVPLEAINSDETACDAV
jgi:hypothetical protein